MAELRRARSGWRGGDAGSLQERCLELWLGLEHVHVAVLIDLVFDLSRVALARGIVSHRLMLAILHPVWAVQGVHLFVVVLVLEYWLDEALFALLCDTPLLVREHAVLEFEAVAAFVGAIGLSVMDVVLRLIRVDIEVPLVLVRVVTVHVADLATVERVMRLLVHGLLDDEVDRLVLHVMERV